MYVTMYVCNTEHNCQSTNQNNRFRNTTQSKNWTSAHSDVPFTEKYHSVEQTQVINFQ